MSIPQKIKQLANKVRNEIFGVDVRESIAKSMEVTGETAEEAKDRSIDQLERVDRLIKENPQPSEVVDARGNHNLLGDRLNSVDQNLAQTPKEISDDVDFVKLLADPSASKVQIKINGKNDIDVRVPYKSDDVNQRYGLYKLHGNGTDGDIRIRSIQAQSFNDEEVEVGSKNYDSDTGSWNKTSPPTYYGLGSASDATFTFTFKGTGFDFVHYADNRGGIWEFVIDGDTENSIFISTWSEMAVSPKTSPVVRGLESKEHTVVAYHRGNDPEHPAESGGPRAYAFYDVNGSYPQKTIHFYDIGEYVNQKTIISGGSNMEFALNCKPVGATESHQWIPTHSTSGVIEVLSQKITKDGEIITDWTPKEWENADNIKIIQKLLGKHPAYPNDELLVMELIIDIGVTGVKVSGDITFVRPTDISTGYACMLPVLNTFGKQFVTSKNNNYETIKTDSSRTNLPVPVQSVAWFDPSFDFVMALTFKEPAKVLRINKEDIPKNSMWIHHLGAIQKFYPHVFESHIAKTGEIYHFEGKYMLGEVANASDLLL